MTGISKRLEQVPDPVFSQHIVGDGAAIEPAGPEVVAPFDGEVAQIAQGGHAVALRNSQGIELLIHMGIDTVQIEEKVFCWFVSEGQKVKRGELLARADWGRIRELSYEAVSPCLLLNSGEMKQARYFYGEMEAGKTKLMEVTP